MISTVAALALLSTSVIAEEMVIGEEETTTSSSASSAMTMNKNAKVYGALKMLPVNVSGFQNAYLNDSKSYSDASTGYGKVNYADANTEGYSVGLTLGYETEIVENSLVLAELTYASNYLDLTVGYNYAIKGLMDKLTLKVGPKLGYAMVGGEAGTVDSSLNIITSDGTFRNGDVINMSTSGVVLSAGVEAEYEVTPKLAAFVRADLQFSMFGDPEVSINDVVMSNPSDWHGTTPFTNGLDPFAGAEASTTGLGLMFGVNYKL